MITEIKSHGELRISAETELESYALNQWCEANISVNGLIDSSNLIIHSGLPEGGKQ